MPSASRSTKKSAGVRVCRGSAARCASRVCGRSPCPGRPAPSDGCRCARLMMNSMRARPTPSLGRSAVLKARSRIAEIDHDLCARASAAPPHRSSRPRTPASRLDTAGRRLPRSTPSRRRRWQHVGRVVRADDGRHAELPRHDCGMAGASAAIGDDGGGRFITGSQSGLVVSATSTSPGRKVARSRWW